MSTLLNFSSAKHLWKRSQKLKDPSTVLVEPPDMANDEVEKTAPTGAPVTIAVVGCGQRGKAREEELREHVCGRFKEPEVCGLIESCMHATSTNPHGVSSAF